MFQNGTWFDLGCKCNVFCFIWIFMAAKVDVTVLKVWYNVCSVRSCVSEQQKLIVMVPRKIEFGYPARGALEKGLMSKQCDDAQKQGRV